MDIRKIITFVDLAETLNYTATAERLYLTQATVSKHIQSLEQELNIKMFDRTNRVVQLTDFGRAVLPHAQRMVADYNSFLGAITSQGHDKDLEINIVTIPTIANYRGFSLLTEFHRQNPTINLRIEEVEGEALTTSLVQGSSDIGFLRTFGNPTPNLDLVTGESDHFVVILPKTHQLANANVIDISQLEQENYLLLGHSSKLLAPVMQLANESGFEPHVTYSGQRIDLILDLITSGMGISIMMDKSTDLADHAGLVKVPLSVAVESRLAFARGTGHHRPAADKLWQFLQSYHERFHQ